MSRHRTRTAGLENQSAKGPKRPRPNIAAVNLTSKHYLNPVSNNAMQRGSRGPLAAQY